MAANDDTPTKDAPLTWSSPVVWAAIAVLLAFAWFTIAMIGQTGAGDQKWTRLVYLYGGVEAIVFGAAGALFGTTIQRAQVKDANKKADDAQKNADDHAKKATTGDALTAAIQAELDARAEAPKAPSGLSTESVGSAARSTETSPGSDIESLRRLAALAARLNERI